MCTVQCDLELCPSSGTRWAESTKSSADGCLQEVMDEKLLESTNQNPDVQATGAGPYHLKKKIHSYCQAAQVSGDSCFLTSAINLFHHYQNTPPAGSSYTNSLHILIKLFSPTKTQHVFSQY